MRPTYLRDITEEEKNKLYAMIDDDSSKGAGYRAKIILLRNEGYTVPAGPCSVGLGSHMWKLNGFTHLALNSPYRRSTSIAACAYVL